MVRGIADGSIVNIWTVLDTLGLEGLLPDSEHHLSICHTSTQLTPQTGGRP